MRRILLLLATGALMVALAATAAFAQQNTATLTFEVTEGEYSPDAVYFGLYRMSDAAGSFNSVELADPDGDGTHTGSVELQTGEYMVRIDQAVIGGTVSPIKGLETITLDEDTTVSTRAGFDGLQPQCFLPEGCFLSGDASSETIFGGIGPDLILGGGGHDWLDGQGGGDWLDGGAGDDLVRGEDGDDLVDGGTGHDFVSGGAGNDYVTGYLGNDRIAGGPGNDFVYAADGQFDVVSAGPGYDVCVVDWFDELTGEATPGHGCEELYFQ